VHERLGWRGLAFWTLVFCLHRAVVLWWGFDGAYYWEETYRLLIAEALWNGWSWPLLDLQADPYAGGSLVFSALTVPVVALAGPSLMGLKLVALAWSAAGLVAWTALVDRWWGRRAAHVFAFLFVAAPPLFVVYNLIAMGSHAEVVTLAGVQLLLGYRVLYGGKDSAGALAAWAAVAGAGVWFTYDAALPFVVCAALGVLNGTLPPRHWPALVAGFLVGFAPWIVTNVLSGGQGLEVVARTFQMGTGTGRSLGAALEYFSYLLWTGVPLGLRYPDIFAALTGGAPRRLLLAHLYFALYAASVVLVLGTGSARQRRARAAITSAPELPLILVFPFLLAILAVSDQVFLEQPRVPFFSFRLLVPFLPAVMAVIALAIPRVPRLAAGPSLALLAVIGTAGTVQALHAGAAARPRHVAEARAVGAQAAGHLLYYKHGPDLALLATRIDAMPRELHGPAWEGIGFSLAYHFPPDAPAPALVEHAQAVPPAFRSDAVRGMRMALGSGLPQVPPRPLTPNTPNVRAAIDSLDPQKPDQ